MARIAFLIAALFSTTLLSAKTSAEANNFSLSSGDGSLVVVIVLAVVFAGLFVFLLAIERKLNRLEKKLDNEL